MARAIELKAKSIVVMVLGGEPREVFEYVDGVRTDRPRQSADGRSLWRFEAAVEVDGQPLGACSVFTCTPEVVTGQGMGTRLLSQDGGTVKVLPESQYEVRLSVTVPTLGIEKRQSAA